MKAVDTNVLARFFIDDIEDAQAAMQKPLAMAAMSQPVYVSLTVVLEFEWVMRGFYNLPKPDILRVFKALCSLEHVTIESRQVVLNVIELYRQGIDFADAMHCGRASHCDALLTFDQRLQKRAATLGVEPHVELLRALK